MKKIFALVLTLVMAFVCLSSVSVPAEAAAAPGGGVGSQEPSRPRRPGDAPSVRPDRGEGLPAALLVREARGEPADGVASPLSARRTGP